MLRRRNPKRPIQISCRAYLDWNGAQCFVWDVLYLRRGKHYIMGVALDMRPHPDQVFWNLENTAYYWKRLRARLRMVTSSQHALRRLATAAREQAEAERRAGFVPSEPPLAAQSNESWPSPQPTPVAFEEAPPSTPAAGEPAPAKEPLPPASAPKRWRKRSRRK